MSQTQASQLFYKFILTIIVFTVPGSKTELKHAARRGEFSVASPLEEDLRHSKRA